MQAHGFSLILAQIRARGWKPLAQISRVQFYSCTQFQALGTKWLSGRSVFGPYQTVLAGSMQCALITNCMLAPIIPLLFSFNVPSTCIEPYPAISGRVLCCLHLLLNARLLTSSSTTQVVTLPIVVNLLSYAYSVIPNRRCITLHSRWSLQDSPNSQLSPPRRPPGLNSVGSRKT